MTIFEAYVEAKKKLEAAKIEDYVFEAKQIIKFITGYNNGQILTNYQQPLTEFQKNYLTAVLRQREIRYPLQYIFGEWEFYGRPFKVGVGVLVPRADTEILVEKCLEFLKGKETPKILDLCTGSGCIGITLAKELPTSNVKMLEKYEEAFKYAKQNITLNAAENATLVKGDIFESDCAEEGFDLIVSNPPYIPQNEMNEISPETKLEPETALLGGEDGLDFYKAIIKNYKKSLNKDGVIAFEVGINQSGKVADLLKENGFKDINITKDLNNIERVVTAIGGNANGN